MTGFDAGDSEVERPAEFSAEVRDLAADHDAWSRLELFAALLHDEGELRGLIGPRELPRLWSRHIVNSLAIDRFVPKDAAVCDVGSGAGFPGVVLAIARPDLTVTLVEPMERRCEWLMDVQDALGMENVSVVTARAEDLAGAMSFPVVTARAVAALDKLLRWTWPLVAPEGQLLALKGARAAAEVESAAQILRKVKAEARVHEVTSPLDGSVTRVVEVARSRS